jgi:hypothetical protein
MPIMTTLLIMTPLTTGGITYIITLINATVHTCFLSTVISRAY